MLSILIPIFNCQVTRLVNTLLNQCESLDIPFEIICLDDGSTNQIKNKNRPLNSLFGVNYVELSENVGRSRVRNKLAKLARYDHLLFIDADSRIDKNDFIEKYVQCIVTNKSSVISGGRSYSEKPPGRNSHLLHWRYGRSRESRSAKKRNQRGVALFHSNNFVVPRFVLARIPFDETIRSYGYEDIAFACCLQKAGFDILHINNPVLHTKLRSTEKFLQTVRESVSNLIVLHTRYGLGEVKLIKTYEVLDRLKLIGPTKIALRFIQPSITARLKQPHVNLLFLDLYKLIHLIEGIMQIKK